LLLLVMKMSLVNNRGGGSGEETRRDDEEKRTDPTTHRLALPVGARHHAPARATLCIEVGASEERQNRRMP